MNIYEKALEKTIELAPDGWVWWFVATDMLNRFELIQVYKNEDYISHGLYFGALNRTDANRICHKINEDILEISRTETILVVETISDKLRQIDEAKHKLRNERGEKLSEVKNA